MLAALAEPIDAVTTTATPGPSHRPGRGQQGQREAARTGRPRRRARNGAGGMAARTGSPARGSSCRRTAAAEVGRREAGFARDFQPRDAVERELVRQMALGSWRSGVLAIRIVEHDARVNAARFANWDGGRADRGGGAGPPAGRGSRGRRRPAPAHLGRLRLADRPLGAAGQRPVDRRGGRAGLHGGPTPTWRWPWTCSAGRRSCATWTSGRAGWSRSAPRPGRARRKPWPNCGRSSRARSPSWRSGSEEVWEGVEEPRLRGLAGGTGDRPGGRGDAAAALRGGGRSAVPLGLEEAGGGCGRSAASP